MSRPGKNIRVWDKSTNPGFAGGKEVCVMNIINEKHKKQRATLLKDNRKIT